MLWLNPDQELLHEHVAFDTGNTRLLPT